MAFCCCVFAHNDTQNIANVRRIALDDFKNIDFFIADYLFIKLIISYLKFSQSQ
ncbi:MAG: hypothetical protein ACOZBL_00055 [Patescibacteria group bacterium]